MVVCCVGLGRRVADFQISSNLNYKHKKLKNNSRTDHCQTDHDFSCFLLSVTHSHQSSAQIWPQRIRLELSSLTSRFGFLYAAKAITAANPCNRAIKKIVSTLDNLLHHGPIPSIVPLPGGVNFLLFCMRFNWPCIVFPTRTTDIISCPCTKENMSLTCNSGRRECSNDTKEKDVVSNAHPRICGLQLHCTTAVCSAYCYGNESHGGLGSATIHQQYFTK